MTDEELISSFALGSGAAFPALYARYADRGVRYAYSLLRDEDESEEVVQEAFCRLLRPLRGGDVKPSLGGFSAIFFRTLRNLSIDVLRKRSHRQHLSLEAVGEEPLARSVESEAAMQQAVAQLMTGLSENYRHALELKVNANLSYDEIAESLGATHAQVRTWIFRARRKLEEGLRAGGWLEQECQEEHS